MNDYLTVYKIWRTDGSGVSHLVRAEKIWDAHKAARKIFGNGYSFSCAEATAEEIEQASPGEIMDAKTE